MGFPKLDASKTTHLEDILDHLGDLLLLGIPELTELLAGVLMGCLVAHLGALQSTHIVANHWNAGFMNLAEDSLGCCDVDVCCVFSRKLV